MARRSEPRGARTAAASRLTHVGRDGSARMVDVGDKPSTGREAVAKGRIRIGQAAMRLLRAGRLKKGHPVEVARLAGIMAAKRTADLIPLCHPLQLSGISVEMTPRRDGYEIEARVRTVGQTGVEMEALTAVSVAALTLYDMVKAADRGMRIEAIRLEEKRGGRSGEWRRRRQRAEGGRQ